MCTKTCFKCNKIKDINEFYLHKGMSDGHLGKCKECTKMDVNERYIKKINDFMFLESERERARNKYHRLYSNSKIKKIRNNEPIKKYYHKYPEKYRAKCIAGKIKSPNGYHNHHWSYKVKNALDIIHLIDKDHATVHRWLKYDQKNMIYRTLDGYLLDTKEKHIEYIQRFIDI